METLILGIGSKCRQGKSTIANFIHQYDPVNTKLYSFADFLKCYCIAFKGMKQKDPTLLQNVGDELRAQKEDIFIEVIDYKIFIDKPRIAILDDARFHNEGVFIKDRQGYTIKVTREGFTAHDRNINHVSEVDLDDWQFDYTISAPDGDLPYLKIKALEVYNQILRREHERDFNLLEKSTVK